MNKVILICRLASDPEIRYAPNGTAICNCIVALDRGLSKEKKAELQSQGKQTADFPRVQAFGKTAELFANHLSKGKQVGIEGHIQTSTYKTQAGETRYSTDIIVDRIEFIGGDDGNKPKNESNEDFNFGGYNPDDFQAIQDDEDIPF